MKQPGYLVGLLLFNLVISTMESSAAGRPPQPTTTISIKGSHNIVRTVTLAIMAVLLFLTGVTVSGIICLVACILSTTSAKGLDVDIRARNYRLFTSLAGYKIGDWERIPEAQGITMKYYSDSVTTSRGRRARTNQGPRYIIMFSVADSNQGVIVYQTAKYEAAKHLTESLAQTLDVEAKIYNKFGQLE